MQKAQIPGRAPRWGWANLILLVACGGWQVEMCGRASAAVPVTEVWSQRYGNVVGDADDLAFRAVCDAVGNIIVTGSTEKYRKDMLTIKYSGTNGSMLWQQRYDGPAGEDDVPQAIGVDASGNVFVTGNSRNSSLSSDIYTAKYSAIDGALLWERRYDGGAGLDDYVSALAVDGQGNAVIRGNSRIGNYFQIYLAKLSPDGVLLWEQHGTQSGSTFGDVTFDGAGDVFVTGTCSNRIYTAKHSGTNGALLWEQCELNPGTGQGRVVATDASGDVVVAGQLFRQRGEPFEYDFDYDLRTAKFSGSDGTLLWERRYNGPADDWDIVHALSVDQVGNAIVAGYSYGTNSGPDAYAAKYAAADGALLWERRYNGPGNGADFLLAADLDSAGNVFVVGYSFNGSQFDFYLAKYATSDGAVLWENRLAGPPDRAKFGQALGVNGNGDILATGYFITPPWGAGDYYTARFAGSDGALQWEQTYDGPWETEDRAVAVGLDSAGNVAVTGGTEPAHGAPFDFYTAKYAATNGTLLWERRYQGPQGYDQPTDLAVDAAGNVIVTGISYETYADFYTAKYGATDGALLWEKRYNGPANFFDEPVAVAVDGQGDVVVTGKSAGADSGFDFYTAKYAAVNGTLLWERRYNGPSNSADIVSALVLTRSGEAVVTGASAGPGGYSDFYTAKYASGNGALLWERRYDGPAHSADAPIAIGTDQFGNVFVIGGSAGTNDAGLNTPDLYMAKYAAADGTLLWERRYSTNFVGEETALGVDAGGDVIVTTHVYDDDNGDDLYLIIKYASADGTVLWQKNSNGGGRAVAVDENGHVVVAGEFFNGNNRDYYLAKFASLDGTLLWEERRDGPGYREDTLATPHSLALGSNGVIVLAGYSGFGAANQADYVTFLFRELPPPVSLSLSSDGANLYFTGVPGRSYTIERAHTVTGPWSVRSTVVAPPGGFIEFFDTNAPAGRAFYRSRSP